MISSDWPIHKEKLHVPVLAHLEVDVYLLSYTKDRMLHVEVNPAIPEEELPEIVKMFAANEMLLNPAIRPALRSMIDLIDKIDQQQAS